MRPATMRKRNTTSSAVRAMRITSAMGVLLYLRGA
jgi:hypothetical protein